MICKEGLFYLYFLKEHYVLDICWNRLTEAIPTNIQNICFFFLVFFFCSSVLLRFGGLQTRTRRSRALR